MSTATTPRAPQSRWLWPFEVLDQIGEGGMGVVYRARYVVNGRHVALKMLPADVTDKTVLARFEREVEVLKNLKHPNIVRCFGGSCEDKRRFYAMELVEGGTLEERLHQKGKLPWEQVVYYGLQICAALECSHGQGVVHRDIKPSNFLLTPSGQVKLSDFGLASVEASRKITAAGKTAGTFLYMAPEQIRGHDVTPQTDLYALGCVLYELLTGIPPYTSETPAGVLHQHCSGPIPHAMEKAVDCPVELDRIICRLLQKDAKDRYPSATLLAADLKRVPQTLTVAATSAIPVEEKRVAPAKPKPKSDDSAATQPIRPTASGWLVKGLIFALFASLAYNILAAPDKHAEVWQERWIEAAGSDNLFFRQHAVDTLVEAAPHSAASREALVGRLLDLDPEIRAKAVAGLESSGAHAAIYVPQLIRVKQYDQEHEIRTAAEKAISTIQAAQPSAGPARSLWLLLAAIAAGLIVGGIYWIRLWRNLHVAAVTELKRPLKV